jgi:hypothetical protein
MHGVLTVRAPSLQENSTLTEEVDSLRRFVEQVHVEQRRGAVLTSVSTRVTRGAKPPPPAMALSQQLHVDAQQSEVRSLLARVERDVSTGSPKALVPLQRLRQVVDGLLADRWASIQREGDLLDTLTTVMQSRGDAADIEHVRNLQGGSRWRES